MTDPLREQIARIIDKTGLGYVSSMSMIDDILDAVAKANKDDWQDALVQRRTAERDALKRQIDACIDLLKDVDIVLEFLPPGNSIVQRIEAALAAARDVAKETK